jgi:hypothetical protein
LQARGLSMKFMGASLPYVWLSYLGTGAGKNPKKSSTFHPLACFASLCQWVRAAAGVAACTALPEAHLFLGCRAATWCAVESSRSWILLDGFIRPWDGRTVALRCLQGVHTRARCVRLPCSSPSGRDDWASIFVLQQTPATVSGLGFWVQGFNPKPSPERVREGVRRQECRLPLWSVLPCLPGSCSTCLCVLSHATFALSLCANCCLHLLLLRLLGAYDRLLPVGPTVRTLVDIYQLLVTAPLRSWCLCRDRLSR